MALAIVVLSMGLARGAHADPPTESDLALSTDLFNKARKKSDAGSCKVSPVGDAAACREARDLFRRSYKLNPAGLGALKGQAQVEESLGLVASAIRHYRELAPRAAADPSAEKKAWAKPALEAAAKLEPRVPHLTLVLPKDAPKDTVVELDDEPIANAAWNVAIDADPGPHVVKAKASGVTPFTAEVTLAEKESKSLEIKLVPVAPTVAPKEAPKEPPKAADPPKEPPKTVDPPKPVDPPSEGSGGTQRTIAMVSMGLGVVGVGVGLGLGFAAKAARDQHCDKTTKLCDTQGSLDSAKGLASGATIVTGVGAALLVGGVVWYVLVPRHRSAPTAAWVSPAWVPGGGALVAGGVF
ncbi:MAG: hypothetical protein JNL79_16245 [Myxococcales bacterium]|nr:hypothetical protein [Myxococcales bacterium]